MRQGEVRLLTLTSTSGGMYSSCGFRLAFGWSCLAYTAHGLTCRPRPYPLCPCFLATRRVSSRLGAVSRLPQVARTALRCRHPGSLWAQRHLHASEGYVQQTVSSQHFLGATII